MAARDVIKNFNVFVDGRGYAGQAEEFTPPKLTLKTEEFRGGGMIAPIKLTMGMEAMDSDFTLIAYDRNILAMFNVVEGTQTPFVLRQAIESYDGTITPVVHTMTGKVTEIDPGTTKAGDKVSLKISMNLSYYKLEHGGTVIHDIDVENMIQVLNGVDLMEATRAALGM